MSRPDKSCASVSDQKKEGDKAEEVFKDVGPAVGSRIEHGWPMQVSVLTAAEICVEPSATEVAIDNLCSFHFESAIEAVVIGDSFLRESNYSCHWRRVE